MNKLKRCVLLLFLAVTARAQKCASCANVKLLEGTDFSHIHTQRPVPGTSPENCCEQCRQRETPCYAFTFRKDTKMCWLQFGATSPSSSVNATSGICGSPPHHETLCVGEFMPCSDGSVCSMSGDCGTCKFGQYLCPSDQKTCIDGPEDYHTCPGMKGTHFDDKLDIEARIDYILNHTTTDEQIAQLW